jgi:hypothetical protein
MTQLQSIYAMNDLRKEIVGTYDARLSRMKDLLNDYEASNNQEGIPTTKNVTPMSKGQWICEDHCNQVGRRARLSAEIKYSNAMINATIGSGFGPTEQARQTRDQAIAKGQADLDACIAKCSPSEEAKVSPRPDPKRSLPRKTSNKPKGPTEADCNRAYGTTADKARKEYNAIMTDPSSGHLFWDQLRANGAQNEKDRTLEEAADVWNKCLGAIR